MPATSETWQWDWTTNNPATDAAPAVKIQATFTATSGDCDASGPTTAFNTYGYAYGAGGFNDRAEGYTNDQGFFDVNAAGTASGHNPGSTETYPLFQLQQGKSSVISSTDVWADSECGANGGFGASAGASSALQTTIATLTLQ